MRSVANALLIVALIAATPALAQQEPPARVGRVALVAGQLGFHEKGETTWSKASVNYPVAAGGAFWTDPKSRAEFRIGSRRSRCPAIPSSTSPSSTSRSCSWRCRRAGSICACASCSKALSKLICRAARCGSCSPASTTSMRRRDQPGGSPYRGQRPVCRRHRCRDQRRRHGGDQRHPDIGRGDRESGPDEFANALGDYDGAPVGPYHVSPQTTGYECSRIRQLATTPIRDGIRARCRSAGPRIATAGAGSSRGVNWIIRAGFRAVPLRPLGLHRRAVGLGAGRFCRRPGLCAGAGILSQRSGGDRDVGACRSGGRLVPAGAGRGLFAVVQQRPELLPRDQHRNRL